MAVATCFAANSYALPTDPTVANGSAAFAKNGNVLTVTNSNGAIINWQKFSIGANETTRFIQTSASSAVLNRVLANDPSLIYGTLSSNGRVWLVNPAGIMVGAGGRVDTAGFVASTLNIRNEDFLAGRKLFESTPGAGSVVNQGSITTPSGGSVYLIGPDVSNEGIITTPQGETILAAGQTVSLLDTATPGVKVDITGAEGDVTNLGTVIAEAGRIGMAGVLVKNSGTLNASSVVSEGGRIFLRASQDAYVDGSGRIVATGTKGGSVEVLGNRVAVMDNASIDASATSEGGDGGSIKVGGDYQGRNPDIQNASFTYFGPNAGLKADAGKVGDGGTVIVWADDTTRAYGNISARGGALGGNGGLIETSGKHLETAGIRVNASAPHGRAGSWLLDPANIQIVNGAGTDANVSYGGGLWDTSADTAVVYGGNIASALNLGTSVVIQTGAYGGSTQLGDITMSGVTLAVTPVNATSLTLRANRSIAISGSTISSAAYGLDVTLNAHYLSDAAAGNVQITNSSISTNGGNVVIGGGLTPNTISAIGTTDNSHGIEIYDSSINAAGGNILLSGIGGAAGGRGVYIHDFITTGSLVTTSGAGTLTIKGQGTGGYSAINIKDASTVVSTTGTGTLFLDASLSGATGARGVHISDGANVSTGSGILHIKGQGGASNSGVKIENTGTLVTTVDGQILIEGTAGAGSGLTGVSILDGSSVTATGIGSVYLIGQGGAGIGVNIYGGSVMTNGGSVTIEAHNGFVLEALAGVGGTISTYGGGININAYGGSVSGGGQIDSSPSAAAASAGSITVSGTSITLGNISAKGADGSSSASGARAGGSGGTVSLTATAGDISVGAIDTHGGDADSGVGGRSGGASGGNGGYVQLTANGAHAVSGKAISVTGIDTRGGHGYGGGGGINSFSGSGSGSGGSRDAGNGGIGGAVNITSYGGGVTVTSIDTRGGDGLVKDSGGGGGYVTVAATNGTIGIGQIDTRGGNGNNGGGSASDGGGGGAVTLTTVTTGNITVTDIKTSGGNGGSDGGSGGSVTLTTDTGNITAITIDTHGGNGSTSYGRAAGGVMLTTNISGDISVGAVSAYGGSGPGRGGDGGTVSMTAGGGISVGIIDTHGGNASGSSNSGGRGGDVSLTANGIHAVSGKAISVDSIDTHGGDENDYDDYQNGGNVTLLSRSTGISLTGTAIAITSINTRGGNDVGSSSAGDGGAVNITSYGGGVTVTSIDTRGGNAAGSSSGGDGGNVTIAATNGSVAVGYINVAGGTGSSSGSAGNINIDAYGNIGFSQVGDVASTTNLTVSSTAGDIAIGATGNMTIYGGSFTSSSDSSTILSAGGTLNLTSNLSITGSLGLTGSSVIASSPVTASATQDIVVIAGVLDLSGSAKLDAGADLGILAGAVNLTSGSMLKAGNEIEVAANFLNLNLSQIEATASAATIAVTKSITLDDGSYIKAGTDVKLKLNGADSLLTLNSASGQTPSYIWAQSPNTIFLSFPLLASGGVVIDGKQTLETVAGGSGLFVGPTKTPATDGSGLSLAYLPQSFLVDTTVTKDLAKAISSTTTDTDTTTPTSKTDDSRQLDDTTGGNENQFGEKEEGDDKDKDKDKDKNKSADSGGDKPRSKEGQKRVATCS